jgi:hypothetical protein
MFIIGCWCFQRNPGKPSGNIHILQGNIGAFKAVTAFESWLTTSSRPPFVPGVNFRWWMEGVWARGLRSFGCIALYLPNIKGESQGAANWVSEAQLNFPRTW